MSFLFATGALICTLFLVIGPLPFSLAVTTHMLRDDRKPPRSRYLLTGVTLWLAAQMATATGLAFLGLFALVPVLLCEALWLAIGWWLLWRTPWPAFPSTPRVSARTTLLPLLTLGYIGLLAAGNLLLQPTTDYDSLYYHLPFAANLYAGGGLLPYHVPAAVAWYPFGWEAFCALFLLPLSTDLLILLPNLLAWALLGLALYCTTRTLGMARGVAILPALLLLSQPLLIDQLIALRVDLALAALFVVGVALIVTKETAFHTNGLLLLLLVVFLLAAVKMSGLIYGALLLLGWATRWLWLTLKGQGDKAYHRLPMTAPLSPALMLLVGLTFATSSLWYGRNWLRYGNPMGETAIQLGGWQLFPGELTQALVRQTTLFALFDRNRIEHWQLLLGALWQKCELPGLLLLLLALVGLFGFVRSNGPPSKRLIGVIGGILLLLSAIYWGTPYSGDDGSFGYQLHGLWVAQSLRFALPAFAILGILATFGVSRLTMAFPRLASWLMVVLLVASLLSIAQRSPLYLLGVTIYIVPLLLYPLLPRVRTIASRPWTDWWRIGQAALRWQWYAMGLSSLVVAALLLLLLQRLHAQQQKQIYGELPTLIAERTTVGEAILAVDSHQSYLAQASSLQRRVLHLSHAFATADAFQAWLVQEQISLIIVGPLRSEWQEDPLVVAVTNPAAPYTLIWDGWASRPRLYQLRVP